MHYVDFPVRIRDVEVTDKRWLTDTMVRITFGGPGAHGFESGIFDEHVKVIFPDPETGELRLPTPDGDELDWPRPFPTSREYTIREHRPQQSEFDIDFVAHPGGLASQWAAGAQVGDRLHVAGPPGGYRVGDDYDLYVVAGDETALPAISRWLDEADETVRAAVYVEVPGPGSRQPLRDLPGVDVTWLPTSAADAQALARAVRATPIPAGADVFVWLAGEAGAIKPLRRWVRDDLGLSKEHSSITGYWKRGHADTHEHLDDEHRDDEHRDDEHLDDEHRDED